MNSFLVSVIVPVYNAEKYIHRCVDSILAQTYTNLEIILVDDGSPDNCPAICDEYAKKDSRIKVIHKENGGVSSARNAGLEIFCGDYLTFVDSDDFIGKNFIKNLVDNMDEEIGIVISKFKFISPDLEEIKRERRGSDNTTVLINKDFDFTENTFNGEIGCKLYRKSVISKLSFSEDIYLGEDTVFNAKAFCNSHAVRYIPDSSYYYIQYAESLSHGKLNKRKITLLSAWEQAMKTFPEDSTSYTGCANVYITNSFQLYGKAVVLQGPDDEIVKYLYSLIKSDKTHSIYKIAPKTLKLRLKYNLLIHFRKIYDTLLLLKEPIVKHYRND